MDKGSNKLSFYAVILALLCMFTIKCKLLSEKDLSNTKQPVAIAWDIFGYYMYLPSNFIYSDPYLENEKWVREIRAKYDPSPTSYQFRTVDGKKQVNIYMMGHAIIWAPGFFVAHWLAEPLGYVADGYSLPYQFSLIITAMLFTIIGLFLTRKILLEYFNDKITSMVLILIVFGTNYFFQVGLDGTMPHNFIFTMNAAILWLTIRWHKEYKLWQAVTLGLVIGLSILVRPTQIIWVLVPLLWNVTGINSAKEKWVLYKTKISHLILYSLSIAIFGLLQALYWKAGTGKFIYFAPSESFSLLSPYTFEFLFSFKKGWLIYTPVMSLSLIGFILLFRTHRNIALALTALAIAHIYLLSSWECWWFAASFSQRPMVDIYPLLAITAGVAITALLASKKTILYTGSVVITLLISLNLFQTWQYSNNIISPDRMTRKYYREIFLKTCIPEGALQYLEVERSFETEEHFSGDPNNFVRKVIFHADYEGEVADDKKQGVVDTFAFAGKKCFRLDSMLSFSPSFNEEYYSHTDKSYIWIIATVKVFPLVPVLESNSALVVTFDSDGKLYKYAARSLNPDSLKLHQWNEIRLEYLSPYVRHRDDHIQVYYWNIGKAPVYIDDIKVEVLEPKITW